MSGSQVSFYPVRFEDGEARSADDLDFLDGGFLPHFSDPSYPPHPIIPPMRHIYKDSDLKNDPAVKPCYTPYQDYLGLCQITTECGGGRSELSPALSTDEYDVSPASSTVSSTGSSEFGFQLSHVSSRFNELDEARLGALSEFAKNGTTCELDDYDIIQQKVRGQDPPTREIPVVPNNRIKEYLWHKQSKSAQVSATQFTPLGKKKSKMICVFCKNNKEPQHVYTGHVLKDLRGFTACPVLRRYPCPICQAIGDHAHTIKYCPFNNDSEFRTSPSPLRTSRMATGKKRRQ